MDVSEFESSEYAADLKSPIRSKEIRPLRRGLLEVLPEIKKQDPEMQVFYLRHAVAVSTEKDLLEMMAIVLKLPKRLRLPSYLAVFDSWAYKNPNEAMNLSGWTDEARKFGWL